MSVAAWAHRWPHYSQESTPLALLTSSLPYPLLKLGLSYTEMTHSSSYKDQQSTVRTVAVLVNSFKVGFEVLFKLP